MPIDRSMTFKWEKDGIVLIESKVTFICERCGRKKHRTLTAKKKFKSQDEAELYAITRLPSKLPEGWGYKDAHLLCEDFLRVD